MAVSFSLPFTRISFINDGQLPNRVSHGKAENSVRTSYVNMLEEFADNLYSFSSINLVERLPGR
jgi:hypothetical protein